MMTTIILLIPSCDEKQQEEIDRAKQEYVKFFGTRICDCEPFQPIVNIYAEITEEDLSKVFNTIYSEICENFNVLVLKNETKIRFNGIYKTEECK